MAGKPGKSGGRRRNAGRKSFKPNDQQRRQVRTLIACAVKEEVICRIVFDPPISVKTLQKYFRKDLDIAMAQADANVVQSLYEQAVGADARYDEAGRLVRPPQPRVVAAAIFWLKGRCGWREVTESRHAGPDGGAIPFTRLDSLTDAQIDQLLKRLVPTSGD